MKFHPHGKYPHPRLSAVCFILFPSQDPISTMNTIFSPRTNSNSSSTKAAEAAGGGSPKPSLSIHGPDTLVATCDAAGLSVPYKVKPPAGLSGGSSAAYHWSLGTGTDAIEIVGADDQQTVQVRAKQNHFSAEVGDQILKCAYSNSGYFGTAEFAITVAKPVSVSVIAIAAPTQNPGSIVRQINYQIRDQFTNALQEVYAFTDDKGVTKRARVINLLVSEVLIIQTPPSAGAAPKPHINGTVYDGGHCYDNILSPTGVTLVNKQTIWVHVQTWTQNQPPVGNCVATNKITHTGENNIVTPWGAE